MLIGTSGEDMMVPKVDRRIEEVFALALSG